MMNTKKNPLAFTILELLVVLSIITILMTMLLPALNKAREAGRLAVCGSNLHQNGIFTRNYNEGDGNGMFPDLFYHWTPNTAQSGQTNQGNVINIHLEPKWAAAPGWLQYYPYNSLICPSDPDPEFWWAKGFNNDVFEVYTSYAFNVDFLIRDYIHDDIERPGKTAFFFDGKVKLIMSKNEQGGKKQGAYPGTQNFIDRAFRGRHLGVANVLYTDGHVDQRRKLSMLDILNYGDKPLLGPGNSGGGNNNNGGGNGNNP